MARDRGDAKPFNQRNDLGPLAYRSEHDPVDARPLLCWRRFWRDPQEQEAFERAAREIAREARWVGVRPRPVEGESDEQRRARERAEDGRTYLGMATLLREIVSLAEGHLLSTRPQTMPHAPGYRQWEERRWDLKRDALAAEAKRAAGGLRMDHDEVGE